MTHTRFDRDRGTPARGAAFALLFAVAALAGSALASPALAAPKSPAAKAIERAKGRAVKAAQDSAASAQEAPETPPKRRRPLVSKPTPEEIEQIRAEGRKIAVIATQHGTLRVELYDDEAPLTVANFVKLARAGFYDGLTFHRVIREPKPFVVQGGDPLANGMGNPGYTIEGEFSQTRLHQLGTVAMARATDPNSAGSQFYIALAAAPQLDGQYAIFGQVVGGLEVLDALVQGDVMQRVTIETPGTAR
jgi:cyclophilin family peptidyl-prolyl cis-trans isomerase